MVLILHGIVAPFGLVIACTSLMCCDTLAPASFMRRSCHSYFGDSWWSRYLIAFILQSSDSWCPCVWLSHHLFTSALLALYSQSKREFLFIILGCQNFECVAMTHVYTARVGFACGHFNDNVVFGYLLGIGRQGGCFLWRTYCGSSVSCGASACSIDSSISLLE